MYRVLKQKLNIDFLNKNQELNFFHLFISNWSLWSLILFLIFIQFLNTITHGSINKYFRNLFSLIISGEWWRLISAQFIHINWFHLIVDVSCIILISQSLWRIYPKFRLILCFIISGSFGQLFGLLAWLFQLSHYQSLIGSSDAIHGLAYLFIRHNYENTKSGKGKLLWICVMGLILISIMYTCATGTMIISDQMKSPGLNHLGGIIIFLLAVETGFLKPEGEFKNGRK